MSYFPWNHGRNVLTERQEFVLYALYWDWQWSARQIARCLGLKRRMVESALLRHGPALRPPPGHHRPREGLTTQAALEWFTDAGRRDLDDPSKPVQQHTLGPGEVVLIFRKRRCQSCGTLTSYAVDCPTCHQPLDYRTVEVHRKAS